MVQTAPANEMNRQDAKMQRHRAGFDWPQPRDWWGERTREPFHKVPLWKEFWFDLVGFTLIWPDKLVIPCGFGPDFGFVFFQKSNVYAEKLGLFRNINVYERSRLEPWQTLTGRPPPCGFSGLIWLDLV
jgi:hypothetical protein